MGNHVARAFWCLYPHELKPSFTPEGRSIRGAFKALTIIHTIMFVFCLTIVGFVPMLYNLGLASWAYSCYLTLREREMIVYFILIVAALGQQIGSYFTGKEEGSWQSLGGLVNLGIYVLCLYVAARYYAYFRMSGGLRGVKDNSKQAKKYRNEVAKKKKPTDEDTKKEPLISEKEKELDT